MEEICIFEGISYTLVRKNVKNINLRVRSDGTVAVSVPPHVPIEHVERFLTKKKEYIQRNLELFQEQAFRNCRGKQYVSGESIRLFGKDIRLKVAECAKNVEESVDSDGVFLYLNCHDITNRENKEVLVCCFLQKKREDAFHNIAASIFQKIGKYGVDMPQIRISEMKKRWGSCLPQKGVITLNTLLLEAPRPCIEYVILHEMCHLVHPNHSKDFYNFLTIFMPDWKEQKKLLDSYGQNLVE